MAMYALENGVLVPVNGEDPLLSRIDQLMGMSPRNIEAVVARLRHTISNQGRSPKYFKQVLETGSPELILRSAKGLACGDVSAHPQYRVWQHACRTALEEAMAAAL